MYGTKEKQMWPFALRHQSLCSLASIRSFPNICEFGSEAVLFDKTPMTTELPDDNVNMSGVLAVDSSYISFRLIPPLEMNFSPMSCSMKVRTDAIRESGLRILISMIRWNGVSISHCSTMKSSPFGFCSVEKVQKKEFLISKGLFKKRKKKTVLCLVGFTMVSSRCECGFTFFFPTTQSTT